MHLHMGPVKCRSHGRIAIPGYWKRHSGRVVHCKQSFIDANVQTSLCVGGHVKYILVPDSGITKNWCREHVVPGNTHYFLSSDTIVDVWALPLLHAALDSELSLLLPFPLCSRIRTAYEKILSLPDDVNPVNKVPLTVYRVTPVNYYVLMPQ